MKISLIVTNWNGLSFIKKNLETVIKNSPEASELIFIDDGSQDDSVAYVSELQKKYPVIKILKNSTNQGFVKSSNRAVAAATGELVVLLNNDIYPHPKYIKSTLKHFNDLQVLGVGFSELGHENYGRIFWQNGYLQIKEGFTNSTHISAWLSGGSSIIRRDYFLKLGGFDQVYEPFYFEDLDFGLRAWRSGYKLLWEPKSVVEHHHESTTSRFPRKFLVYVKERNHLISVLRNITDPKLLFENKIFSFLRILSGPNYLKIILAAHRQLKKYPPSICFPQRSDKDILKLFENEKKAKN